MILLDTSFLYGYFQKEDAHHEEALKLAKVLDEDQGFTISGVFQELVGLLNRKISTNAAQKVGDLFFEIEPSIQLLKLDDAIFDAAWEKFKKFMPHRLSFVDCLLLATAEHMDVQLLTFDQELKSKLK